MGRFMAGFGAATLLWGAVVFFAGLLDPLLSPAQEEELELATAPESAPEAESDQQDGRRRRRGRRGRGRGRRGGGGQAGTNGYEDYPTGSSTIGDDLRENDPRSISAGVEGGEEQLSNTEIEQGFDQVDMQIRRCLVLVTAPITGTITFGLRIAGTGRVGAVNLTGPTAVTRGEPGACLQRAARSIRFATFDGPDMIVRYPYHLE